MDIIVERFNKIKSNIANSGNIKPTKIIAVSKTFSLEHIMPLIEYGHDHFGENKVQEAESKWKLIKKEKKNIKLHLIGKLQSNKAKKAVEIFDYIHSLDNQKLADILSKSQNALGKSLNYFIQVNIGNEEQKSGIPFNEVDAFYNYCSKEKNMNILGLMAIPPNNENIEKYFKSLSELNSSLGFKDLSMGMSADYMNALKYKATYLRIGSLIFGKRVQVI
jgi:PLP dependent protein